MGYKKDAIKGISWLTGIRVITRLLTFLKTIILARILTPSQFGIFGIATLLLAFIEIITETGINIFLVQRKDEINNYIDTAWIVSIIRGCLIGSIIFFSAGIVAGFFHTEAARRIILLMSAVPFIRGFINPSVIKLQKELLFRRQFVYQTALLLVEAITSIALVVLTYDVSALIYGMLASALAEVFLSFLIVKPIPHIHFRLAFFRMIVNHGKWITSSTIFDYFYQHGDDIAIGRILGSSSLGLYDMAYRISLAPLTDFADVVTKVTFPIFVKISDDRKRLRKAFLKSFFVVVGIVLPIGLALSLFAKEIILLLFGDKWLAAVPALQVLGIFGAIRAISVFSAITLFSIKKQQLFMVVTLTGLLVLGITIVPFIYWWGIIGAGISALSGTIATLPVIAYFLYKYLFR